MPAVGKRVQKRMREDELLMQWEVSQTVIMVGVEGCNSVKNRYLACVRNSFVSGEYFFAESSRIN